MKRLWRLYALVILLCLLAGLFACANDYEKYERSRYDLFDTITVLTAYCQNEREFQQKTENAWRTLEKYHKALDAYNAYDGINNLWYVNAHASDAPVKPEKELFELLKWLKTTMLQSGERVNAGLGAVTSLWRAAAAANGAPPSPAALSSAATHTNFDDVILDYENETVFFKDPNLQLDVGAVGKGFAAKAVILSLESEGVDSYILSIGGNISCGKAPKDGRDAWKVAVKSTYPSESDGEFLYITNITCSTSGDYYRAYTYEGKSYSHIIDPDTLYPADKVSSVTVIHKDPAIADLLSTTLFIAGKEQGEQIAETYNAETIWQE